MRRTTLVLACLLLPVLAAPAQTSEEKKQTIAYVRSLQNPDGGFAPEKGAKSSLRATSAAVRALKYFGGDVPNRTATALFVVKCYDKDSGTFADTPGGKPDVAVNAVGVMAAIELELPMSEVGPKIEKYLTANAKTFEEVRIAAAGLEALKKRPRQTEDWLKILAGMQHKDGTYGEGDGQARATGGAVACWLRLGGKIDNPDAVLAAMRKGQRSDGGFGREKTDSSDLETSYRVMRAFHMLKAKPDAAKLRGFIGQCRNADGGYGVKPGDTSTMPATYFAGIILKWLE